MCITLSLKKLIPGFAFSQTKHSFAWLLCSQKLSPRWVLTENTIDSWICPLGDWRLVSAPSSAWVRPENPAYLYQEKSLNTRP